MKYPSGLTMAVFGLAQTYMNEQENLENIYSGYLLNQLTYHCCTPFIDKSILCSAGNSTLCGFVRSIRSIQLLLPMESAHDQVPARVSVTM